MIHGDSNLAETADGKKCETLDCLLKIYPETVDWDSDKRQAATHTMNIESLQRFRALEWTPAWQQLQKLVVETGTTKSKNPAPKILSWNPDCDPNGLNLGWAKTVDRELRSKFTTPLLGRADLAITLANQLALFDRLHDVPSIQASGLLPKRFGNIR